MGACPVGRWQTARDRSDGEQAIARNRFPGGKAGVAVRHGRRCLAMDRPGDDHFVTAIPGGTVVRSFGGRKGVDAVRRVGGQRVGAGRAAAGRLKIALFRILVCTRLGRHREAPGAPAVAFRGGLLVAEAHGFGHPCPKGEPVALLLRHVCRPGHNECRTPRTPAASGLSDRLSQLAWTLPQK